MSWRGLREFLGELEKSGHIRNGVNLKLEVRAYRLAAYWDGNRNCA